VNFGDILDKWEQGQPSSQKDSMQIWLDKNTIYDKDADAQKAQVPGEHRRRLFRIQPDDIIDIHGATGEKARLLLENFFSNAKDNGYEKLRIIHGKGNRSQGEAVLGKTVREFIEHCPFAGESGYEKATNGGTGATWVFLKN
jgi:DNA-nicking Smr family endonuclease